MKIIITFAILILSTFNNAFTQNLFKDDFSYPVSDSLEGMGGWTRNGVNLPYNIQVKAPGLTYTGYAGSGIGNTVFFSNIAEGDNVSHNFTPQTSGVIYLSYMIRVDSMTATATSGYNCGFNQSTGATFFNTLLYIKKISSTTFNLGIRKSRNVSYSNTIYNTNTTYLAVVKYSFVAGNNNDSAKMYIFSSGVPASEPTLPNAFATDSVDMVNIGQVILSNGYAQGGSLHGSSIKIDGIRAGKTWATSVLSDVRILSENIPVSFSLSQNYPNPFNPSTKIEFSINKSDNNVPVKLIVYNSLGSEVRTLVNEYLRPGTYEVNFNSNDLPSGIYIYRLSAGINTYSKLMTLIK